MHATAIVASLARSARGASEVDPHEGVMVAAESKRVAKPKTYTEPTFDIYNKYIDKLINI